MRAWSEGAASAYRDDGKVRMPAEIATLTSWSNDWPAVDKGAAAGREEHVCILRCLGLVSSGGLGLYAQARAWILPKTQPLGEPVDPLWVGWQLSDSILWPVATPSRRGGEGHRFLGNVTVLRKYWERSKPCNVQLNICSTATFDTLNSLIMSSSVTQEANSRDWACFVSTLTVL